MEKPISELPIGMDHQAHENFDNEGFLLPKISTSRKVSRDLSVKKNKTFRIANTFFKSQVVKRFE